MKKILGFISFIMLLVTLYFVSQIGLKEYFNKYYFISPSLIGKNIDNIELGKTKLPIKIIENSREFSERSVGEIFMQDPVAGKKIKRNRVIRVWVSKGSADLIVPDVKGLNENDAESIISSKGLRIGNISTISLPLPEGEVVSTDPAIGSGVLRGGKISLLVNKNSNKSKVKMPDLLGVALDEAENILQENSLIMGKLTYKEFEGLESGIVVETSVEANRNTEQGAVIDIIISK
ncbi:MAG: PASTA domain-containing protein [Fusobacteriaceae bacterium]